MPINAKEIIDYAHEYDIEVIWGYAWGWSTACKDFNIDAIKQHSVVFPTLPVTATTGLSTFFSLAFCP